MPTNSHFTTQIPVFEFKHSYDMAKIKVKKKQKKNYDKKKRVIELIVEYNEMAFSTTTTTTPKVTQKEKVYDSFVDCGRLQKWLLGLSNNRNTSEKPLTLKDIVNKKIEIYPGNNKQLRIILEDPRKDQAWPSFWNKGDEKIPVREPFILRYSNYISAIHSTLRNDNKAYFKIKE